MSLEVRDATAGEISAFLHRNSLRMHIRGDDRKPVIEFRWWNTGQVVGGSLLKQMIARDPLLNMDNIQYER